MQVWNMLRAARWKYRMQKSRQKSPSRHHRTTLSGYIFATKARIDKRLYRVYNRLSNQVVQPVWQPCWTNSRCLFNTVVKPCLSNRLYNPVWQLVERTVLYHVYKHSTGCETGFTTDLTTGWMFVYTIQPVVKPVVQPAWQPVASW